MPTPTEASVAAIEQWAGTELPAEYRQFLLSHKERIFGRSVLLYGAENLIERNETFQSKAYCPGFIAIGDDSGGHAVIISLSAKPAGVFFVDHGSMDPEEFQSIAAGLAEWINSGCPIPNEIH